MEKDGTGFYTNKPKSEWRRKKSGKRKHYWEKWNDEKENISEETAEQKEKDKEESESKAYRRTTNRNVISTKDICWFLAKRMTVGEEGEEEPISYTQVERFTMALFHVIADLMIDNCVINLDDLGTFRNRHYHIERNDAFQPHFTPNKDLMNRINLSGDKFIAKTYNIGYEIRDERVSRERKAEYHAQWFQAQKRKEQQNDDTDNPTD